MLVRMMGFSKLNLACSILLLVPGIYLIAAGVLELELASRQYIATRFGPPPGMLLVPGIVLTSPGLMLFCVSINIAPKRIDRIFNR